MPIGLSVTSNGTEKSPDSAAAKSRSTTTPTPLNVMPNMESSNRSPTSVMSTSLRSGNMAEAMTSPVVRHSTHVTVSWVS